jgi:hypothetical protein
MDIVAIVLLCSVLAVMILLLWKVDWNPRLTSPTVVASLVAGSAAFAVALTGAVAGVISASYQSKTEIEKTRSNVLLNIVQHYDSSLVPERNLDNQRQRMKIMIESGIVADDRGSICLAFKIQEHCPIQVRKAE